MNVNSATAFALWLAKDQPQLFQALLNEATGKNSLGFWDSFSSAISNIGSGLATAAGSVGKYLTSSQGLDTLSKLSATVLTVKAQKDAVDLQTRLAQANRAPAPIETGYNPATGQYEAVITQQTSQGVYTQPLNAQTAAQYTRGLTFPVWAPYALIAVGGVVLFLILRRR